MNYSSVKLEFNQWINTLDQSTLSDTDKKFLNLLINNFDEIASLGTVKGARAHKIGQLIEKQKATLSSVLPDLSSQNTADSEVFKSITELKIGPFRGFSIEETFTFDKKYTFMYGPNGSGKSSFCEGLEYALIGGIEEAESRRINVSSYTRNTQTGKVKNPTIYGLKADGQKGVIKPNPTVYRFSFVEKNRIDGFARIAATTTKNQQDRIASLFGLDAFNEFVNNFTDNFDCKYLTLTNQKEIDFNTENQKNETAKARIVEIDKELAEHDKKSDTLIKEIANEGIKTLEEAKIYLVGEDGTKGMINSLQEKKAASVPTNEDITVLQSFTERVKKLNNSLISLTSKMSELEKSSSEINFKDLYTAIELISKDTTIDKSVCPACKTPVKQVVVDPFINAVSELSKMKNLATLQADIEKIAISLSKETREANEQMVKLNKIKDTVGNKETAFSLFTEFTYTGVSSISSWKGIFAIELRNVEKSITENTILISDIQSYNDSLQLKRDEKEKINSELSKHQAFKQKLDEIAASKTNLTEEKTKNQTAISKFMTQNEQKLKEIQEVKKEIDIHNEFIKSYKSLIEKLKKHRELLPSQLATGLSNKTQELYNIINDHDPDFEKLEYLKLPTVAGDKINIRFLGDKEEHDALMILSEGHIKILGLSLLLSKVINEDLGFIIYDDIVNAIDDEHRDGIAELLLKNPHLKDRQHIITCHGEIFVSKLEQKLGASVAGKEVKSYRFVPSDIQQERGVTISIGDSKHYLLLARKSLKEDARKDVASRCRQAIESISEQLWRKLGKKLNINLTVQMRSPGSKPDLSSVVDSLIQKLHGISGLNELQTDMKQLKEKYNWLLLNKGTHEQADLPEFERKDVSDLLTLVEKIETNVNTLKIEVSST